MSLKDEMSTVNMEITFNEKDRSSFEDLFHEHEAFEVILKPTDYYDSLLHGSLVEFSLFDCPKGFYNELQTIANEGICFFGNHDPSQDCSISAYSFVACESEVLYVPYHKDEGLCMPVQLKRNEKFPNILYIDRKAGSQLLYKYTAMMTKVYETWKKTC